MFLLIKELFKVVLLLVMLPIVAFPAYLIFKSAFSSGSTSESSGCSVDVIAEKYAKESVKEVLKDPSSAKFSNVSSRVKDEENCIFVTSGYVSAKNSFGAYAKSSFEVESAIRRGQMKPLTLSVKVK